MDNISDDLIDNLIKTRERTKMRKFLSSILHVGFLRNEERVFQILLSDEPVEVEDFWHLKSELHTSDVKHEIYKKDELTEEHVKLIINELLKNDKHDFTVLTGYEEAMKQGHIFTLFSIDIWRKYYGGENFTDI